MKHRRIADAWNKIEPDSDADRRMLAAILSDNRSEKSRRGRAGAMNRKINWKVLAPVAACLVLALAIAVPLFSGGGNSFDLKRSRGVKVAHVHKLRTPAVPKADLTVLTEEELFGETFRDYEVVAFEGTIVEVRNIVCDYSGAKDYRAIATIGVQEVLRGNLTTGATVTVLLPGPVDVKGLWIEDTGVSSQMRAGTRGIFMPIRYDETSIREENGVKLALLDLAAYGLLDGERWAFLETAEELTYYTWAYPSLAGAKNLEEVKEIILPKLK